MIKKAKGKEKKNSFQNRCLIENSPGKMRYRSCRLAAVEQTSPLKAAAYDFYVPSSFQIPGTQCRITPDTVFFCLTLNIFAIYLRRRPLSTPCNVNHAHVKIALERDFFQSRQIRQIFARLQIFGSFNFNY